MLRRPSLGARLAALLWLALAAGLAAGRLICGPPPQALPFFLVAALGLPLAWLLARSLTAPCAARLADLARRVEHPEDGGLQGGLPAEFVPLAQALDRAAATAARDLAEASAGRERLDAVFNGMSEGVMVLDREGRLISVNRSLERILPGVSDRNGRRLLEILPNAELADACEELLRGGGPAAASLTLALDETRVFSVNVVRPAERTLGLGAVLVFHDVSEIKRLEAVRRDFAANVSHELRTPLTAIKGYAETLITGDPPPELVRRFLEVILRNADHMAKMVEDLLSLSRIEAGKDAGVLEPMQARDALFRAWDAVELLARGRNVDLDNGLPEDLPRVLGDPGHVTRVFRNLLENAVKFGPEQRPVRVRAAERGEFLEFEVRDEGPGIPKKDQPRVFERFYSVQKHRRNEFGSTGLGLAICRHTLRNLGGEIRVESPPPDAAGGTSFFFTLRKA
jgi:two-component system phosphate regulon sensor histidine kinase PhoR